MYAQFTATETGRTDRAVCESLESVMALVDAPEECAAADAGGEHSAATIEVLGVPSSSLTPVDLAALKARCLGNMDLVGRVLAKFGSTGKADLQQLEAAVAQSDFATVSRIGHRFKGAAANVSAARLHLMATYIEQLAREQNVAELQEAIAQTRGEWEVFSRFTSENLPRAKTSPARPNGRTE
jgi:HPt (histidine-containing phosphotransfer) domain-containing protein